MASHESADHSRYSFLVCTLKVFPLYRLKYPDLSRLVLFTKTSKLGVALFATGEQIFQRPLRSYWQRIHQFLSPLQNPIWRDGLLCWWDWAWGYRCMNMSCRSCRVMSVAGWTSFPRFLNASPFLFTKRGRLHLLMIVALPTVIRIVDVVAKDRMLGKFPILALSIQRDEFWPKRLHQRLMIRSSGVCNYSSRRLSNWGWELHHKLIKFVLSAEMKKLLAESLRDRDCSEP